MKNRFSFPDKSLSKYILEILRARYESRMAYVLDDKTLMDKQTLNPQRMPEEMPEGCPQAESEFLKGKSCDFKKSEIFLHDFG